MESDQLILNITTEKNFHDRKKNKVSGNRGQRIKQRRQIHQRQSDLQNTSAKFPLHQFSEFDSGITPDLTNATEKSVTKRDGLNVNFETHRTDRNEKTTAKQFSGKNLSATKHKNPELPTRVISSLFKNNPEAPVITTTNVETIKEDVFSERSFSDLPLHKYLVNMLEEKFNFTRMTRVQNEAIPKILEGKDVLLKSQTGSGKTLSYAVPIIQMLQSREPRVQRSDGVYALIIVPTRELVQQSMTVLKQLVHSFCWIVPGCLMGGENRKAEKSRIRKGLNVLVCTPGRLLDHIEHTSNMWLNNVQWLVIDEADRLLDLGYEQDITKVIGTLKKCEKPHQTILLSATLSDRVKWLAGLTLHDPHRIYVSMSKAVCLTEEDSERTFALPQRLQQQYVVVPAKLRLITLAAFILSKLRYGSSQNKMVVFLSTQDSVAFHYFLFSKILNSERGADSGVDTDDGGARDARIPFFQLYGDMTQKDRTKAYQDFHAAPSGVLLCTDVASRGLDLPKVSWIVQYTTPGAAKDYIHRVGRTARIGTKGHALLFLMPSESEYVNTLAKHHIVIQAVEVKEILRCLLFYTADIPPHKFFKRDKPRTAEESATFLQNSFENYIFHNSVAFDRASKAYMSFVRAYATYPAELKSIFHIKNLHLGHLAKSFALCEPPSKLSDINHHRVRKKRKQPHDNVNVSRSDPLKRPKKTTAPAIVSEFDSGLDFVTSAKGVAKKRKTNFKRH